MKGGDIEAGGVGAAAPKGAPYPGTTESPELRWALIRKVYVVLSLQILLTAVVAVVVVKVRAIPHFFVSSYAGLGFYVFLLVSPFIAWPSPIYFCSTWPSSCIFPGSATVHIYRQKHPINLLLLGVFTVAISLSVGLTCAFNSGKVILEAGILTTVVVLSLTACTFWAARRGKDFSFLGPFLFASLMMLLVFGFIQILFPLGKLSHTIYGALAALIFSGYIVYDTNNIIKRYMYDDYVWAAVSLYLDIINLFLGLLTLFRAADS